MFSLTTLPNGLTVVTSSLPGARSSSLYVLVRAGSRYETPANRGVGHFLEHMLFKGTERHPTPEKLATVLESVGGLLNAEAGKESMMLWAKVAARHLPRAVDLLADMVLHPRLAQTDIDKERRVIVEELSATLDEASDLVDLKLEETLWGDQPIGWDVGGTVASVEGITRDDLLAFQRAYYSPHNTVVSVAGPQPHAEVVALVASALAGWRGAPVPAWPGAAAAPTGPRLTIVGKDTQQSYVSLGFRALSYLEPESYALDLINIILGEAMSSRLFSRVRETLGLAYDVQSYVNHLHDAGTLTVYAAVDPRNVSALVDVVMAELRDLRETIRPAELELAREYWKGRLELRLEDTAAIAAWNGWQQLLTGTIQTPDQVTALIESFTVDDLTRVARRVFTEDRIGLAVVGRSRGTATLDRRLRLAAAPKPRRSAPRAVAD